jgi:RNA polymerase sigma-70 factor (ECF subfamily)
MPSPALRWLEEHGDALYAFAIRRVRRAEVAEDLVQETLLAALSATSAYAGRSAERTWLIGVMKHKLIDHLRKTLREQERGDVESDGSAEFFDERGRWKIKVSAWRGDPGAQLENDEFRAALESCLSKLPARIAQVFWLREAEDMESEWLCRELRITPANLWAMLHRARLGLRRCLSVNWFGGEK